MSTVVKAERMWNGGTWIEDPVVVLEDGVVRSVAARSNAELPAGATVIDFGAATLAPAFFDVHMHGAAGHDVMEATAAALDAVGTFLASRGTGSYLATTVTAGLDDTLRAVEGLGRRVREGAKPGQATPIGIHLEGPFLSHAKRGVQPEEYLRAPDIGVFDRLFDASEGTVRLMTMAPELPGAVELTAHATSRGVRISVGHSNATAAETHAVIDAGAASATHTFNAMRPLDHREPGILGTILTAERLYAELICDGIHTAPEMVKLWRRCKGAAHGILVTDAMSAAGMPDGEYVLGGFPVQVANGRAMARGVLAGSVLTLDRALENFVAFTGAALEESLPLLTVNPAAMTGFGTKAGALDVGMPASLVAVDKAGRLAGSIVNGVPVTR